MGGRMWFWLIWASAQLGGQLGRVAGVARAARAVIVPQRRQRVPKAPTRSVYVRPVRPHERSGLEPRHSAGRRGQS